MDRVTVAKALLSVSDKRGLEALCRALHLRGTGLYATGGTHKFIEGLGLPCTAVESVTQFPEMMEGRVKTLHPRIFGGVLARRDHAGDTEDARRFEIPLFDLVVVNLYRFAEHLGESPETQSAFIDIGGPSLLRAAAKNSKSVAVLSDPDDYEAFLQELDREGGATRHGLRHTLATRTFGRTSAYDARIAAEWGGPSDVPAALPLQPRIPLRYGENPHQTASWCGTAAWECLQGKELSYNNLLDAEAAVRLCLEFELPAACVIKHNSPCGVSTADLPLAEVAARAIQGDPKSAFGGIVAVNRNVDATAAAALASQFLEVIVAPDFTPDARETLAQKKNLRLIRWPSPKPGGIEVRAAMGGWLAQSVDAPRRAEEWKTVTRAGVSPSARADLALAWSVCKHARSNAIVIARELASLGIGAGQVSRVDAVEIALRKSPAEKLRGAVLASDAFFPFRDSIDLLKDTGIAAVIQPGGSVRDPEVVAACDEYGIAMIFTGTRHFRH